MDQPIFGPPFNTTAADRNARMEDRLRTTGGAPEAPGGACGNMIGHNVGISQEALPVQVRDGSAQRPLAHVTFQEGMVGGVTNSTRRDVMSLQDVLGNHSLIDIDNEVLENAAAMASDGLNRVGPGQGSDPHQLVDSPATQYQEIFTSTRRADVVLPCPFDYRGDAPPSLARGAPLQPTPLRRPPCTPMQSHPTPHPLGAAMPLPPPTQLSMGHAPQSYAHYARPVNELNRHHDYDTRYFGSAGHHAQNLLSKTEIRVVMEMLNKINVVDGTDEIQLVNFLKQLAPIFDIAPSCSGEIIKLLIPKVKGQMFRLCMEAVTAQASWNVLHEEILSRFIPPLRRREIVSFELDRPQNPSESFSEYVEHLISVAFALKTSLSEKEVIEIALNKCRPEIRSHFTFGHIPQNVYELRSLANRVTSAVRAEERYFGNVHNRTFTNSAYRQGPSQRAAPNKDNNFQASDLRNRSKEKIMKCFRCNQEGHVARNCRVNLN